MSEGQTDVLVVDDDPQVRKSVIASLTALHYSCEGASNAEEAQAKLRQKEFQLVFLDINMPGMSGLELLPIIKANHPDAMVIMFTALADLSVAVKAMRLGAEDYISKPVNIEHLQLAAERALVKRELLIEHRDYQQRLEETVREQTSEIAQQRDAITRLYEDTVATLTAALETKDRYTEGHSQRVTRYGLRLAQAMGLSTSQLHDIEVGGLMHDIGKIGVPDAVLIKEGKLTVEEFEAIKKHPALGADILGRIWGINPTIVQCARSHHEKWDGKGYPDGLAGEAIPLPGRILAVSDAFDAMTSSRSYRPAMSVQDALDEVKHNAGTQFDPELAALWLDLMNYRTGGGGNILVVDDEVAIRRLFEEVLTSKGHRVVTVASGFQALSRIHEEPFDLIYLDINMPGLDGAEALEEIKHYRPDAFAVVITGFPDDPRVQQMLRSGAERCLAKPLSIATITDVTGELLNRRFGKG